MWQWAVWHCQQLGSSDMLGARHRTDKEASGLWRIRGVRGIEQGGPLWTLGDLWSMSMQRTSQE